jgi:uncharacterized protein involved in outer membrane biogenesis
MTTDNPTSPTPPASPTPEKPSTPAKKGPMRIVGKILLVLIVLIVIGLVVVFMKLNEIVRRTVETQSTASLNVPTKLQAANVSVFGGEVGLKGFDVGSPEGFKAPAMMSLGGIDVGVKLSELRGDPIKVNQIDIKDPKMVIEMQGMAFNIKKFIDSLPAGEEPKTSEGKEPLKLIINDLKVTGAQVIFRPDLQAMSAVPGIGKGLSGIKQEYVLSIPPLNLQNIGSGEGNQNGAAIKEIVSLLVTQLAAKATESDQLPPELRQILGMNVKDITNMVKAKIGEQVNQQLGKVTEELNKKIGGEAGQALGDILKNSTGSGEGSTTKPDVGKAVEQGLGNLLNKGDKKKK